MNNRKFTWAICPCCDGEGRCDNPAFSNGFTSSEWAEMDVEERDAYLVGVYDVTCAECKGSGKVQTPNVAAMTFGEKRGLVEQRRTARYRAESAAEYAAERRMGA